MYIIPGPGTESEPQLWPVLGWGLNPDFCSNLSHHSQILDSLCHSGNPSMTLSLYFNFITKNEFISHIHSKRHFLGIPSSQVHTAHLFQMESGILRKKTARSSKKGDPQKQIKLSSGSFSDQLLRLQQLGSLQRQGFNPWPGSGLRIQHWEVNPNGMPSMHVS